MNIRHTVYPQDALSSGPGTYRRQVHLPRVRSDSYWLFLQTDAPNVIYPEKKRKTCLTVPQSVLTIILIVNISVRTRMALKSYARNEPPSVSLSLYSFTSSCHSLMQQCHRKHAHHISEWRKGATNPAHSSLSRLFNDVSKALQAPPTSGNAGKYCVSLVLFNFARHIKTQRFVFLNLK